MEKNKVYAKSENAVSIFEHNQDLLDRFEQLKNSNYLNYDFVNKYSKAIEKIIYYHDLGKLNHKFQNKIRIKLGLTQEFIKELKDYNELPHEWLSLCFISKEDRKYFKTLNYDDINFYYIVEYSIAFHHSRSEQKKSDFSIQKLQDFVKYDLEINKAKLNVENKLRDKFNINEIKRIDNPENFDNYYELLIFIKGILHKCDYSASANIPAEIIYKGNYNNDFSSWLGKQEWGLKDCQIKAKEKYSNHSVIFIASTGAGKTEYSMQWINGSKAFYLLGLRMAVNEMYKRFKDIFNRDDKENVSLLHGDTNYFVADEVEDDDEYFDKLNKTRQLSYPITIATADQLVKAVFKYDGFELIYFICSYSKVVLDEIQSFTPEAISAIVIFLKEIHNLGGRFLLMTATLPPFVKDEFEDMNVEFPEPYFSEKIRHKIKMIDKEINSDISIELIKKFYEEGKKVLVICNTVSKAQEVYDELGNYNPNLLHSRYTKRYKKIKEYCIMKVSKSKNRALWISTQIVEASLDIDFDVLFTECSSIESLFQRFGRCYRKRDYTFNQPNIYIFKPSETTKYIYDNDLIEYTWNALYDNDNKVITEKAKQEIIEKVFDTSRLKTTKYWENYKRYKDLLKNGFKAKNKCEAQKIFRQIYNQINVIPKPAYEENKDKIIELIKIIDNKSIPFIERVKSRSKLQQYVLSIQIFDYQRAKSRLLEQIETSEYCKDNIFIIKGVDYSFERGFTFIKDYKDCDNFIE